MYYRRLDLKILIKAIYRSLGVRIPFYLLCRQEHLFLLDWISGVIVKLACLECSKSWVLSPHLVKPKTIKLGFVASPLSMQHYVNRGKTGWLRIRIMYSSGPTCLTTDCCISELVLLKSSSAYWSSTKQKSSSSHQNISIK